MDFSPELIEKFEKKVRFVERIGLKIVEMKPRYVKLSVPLNGNENHINNMYAGALFTLAEVPGGILYEISFHVPGFVPIVKEMTIRFRRPAKTDVTIEMSMTEDEVKEIEATAKAQGKADYILNGEIKDQSGEVVALSEGVYQMRALSF